MKKPATTSTPDTAVSAPAAAPIPVLDPKLAKAVPHYRHEPTARTAGFHQGAGDAGVHLFSATGNFIATVPAVQAIAFEPKPAPVAEPVAESDAPAPEAAQECEHTPAADPSA